MKTLLLSIFCFLSINLFSQNIETNHYGDFEYKTHDSFDSLEKNLFLKSLDYCSEFYTKFIKKKNEVFLVKITFNNDGDVFRIKLTSSNPIENLAQLEMYLERTIQLSFKGGEKFSGRRIVIPILFSDWYSEKIVKERKADENKLIESTLVSSFDGKSELWEGFSIKYKIHKHRKRN